MINKNILKGSLLSTVVAMALTSCQEEINLGAAQLPGQSDPSSLVVSDDNGNSGLSTMEYRNTGMLNLTARLGEARTTDSNLTFSYDATALDDYNLAKGTSYEALPSSMVSLSNGGVVTVKAGQKVSEPLTLSLISNGTLNPDVTYAVPLVVTDNVSRNSVAAPKATQIVLVKDLTSLPDCFKTVEDSDNAIKMFAVMEMNDTNPLTCLRYTLKNSGKYMFDALVMFSGNINYDSEAGKVYFYANDNIQYCLDHYNEVLKPLKDRGMKLIMGVMCNHDRACIAGLNAETAKLFAEELTAVCEAYDLDGIFWDDEYCNHSPNYPGFTTRSSATWSRLAYEYKKLNPERWNVAYGYSTTNSATSVDGAQPGEFIDYVLPDYGYSAPNYTTSFAGLDKSGWGAYSIECTRSITRTEANFSSMRSNGYGALMMFAYDPYRSTGSQQDQAVQRMARAFYDDEAVIDYTEYRKTW